MILYSHRGEGLRPKIGTDRVYNSTLWSRADDSWSTSALLCMHGTLQGTLQYHPTTPPPALRQCGHDVTVPFHQAQAPQTKTMTMASLRMVWAMPA